LGIHDFFRPQLQSLLFSTILLLTASCGVQVQALEQASRSYKAHKDYASLEAIYRHLSKRMERGEVEDLLGEPDYSPIEGLYYYSSSRRKAESRGKEQINLPVGLVVDYRDKEGLLTEKLQIFQLGSIEE